MTINALIIDDNEADRYILKRWLGTCSFDIDVVEASDGQNAIDYFAGPHEANEDGYPPTVIFLDINMPRLGGFDFLRRFADIRQTEELSSTVVVMFTSSPRQDDRDEAFQWDFVDDFIVKGSFDTGDLERVISRAEMNRIAPLPPLPNAQPARPLPKSTRHSSQPFFKAISAP